MSEDERINQGEKGGGENPPMDNGERSQCPTPASPIDTIGGSATDPLELKRTFQRILAQHGVPEAASKDEQASGRGGEGVSPEMGHLQQLRERLDAIEDSQAEILSQLDAMSQAMEQQRKSLLTEIARLRRNLLEDRARMASSNVLHTTVPWLNSLRAMHRRTPPRQRALSSQLAATIDILRGMLQGLGFSEFHAQLGEPFDPARMECVGYATGKPGVVLAEEHPGYCIDQTVFFPAGVYITDPKAHQKVQRDQ